MTTPPRIDPRISLVLRTRRDRFTQAAELARLAGTTLRGVRGGLMDLARGGFEVETHPLQGVRLTGVPPSLREDELAWDRHGARVGRRVRCVETAGSTSDLAWGAAETEGAPADGLAVFAEYQTAGRGRRGSRWLAPPHEAVLCSVLLFGPGDPFDAASLTRAAAVAAAEAVEDQASAEVGIKWPNDLVMDDRKVGGILVETRSLRGGPGARPGGGAVVIGIGLNCHQGPEAFPPAIRPQVASPAMLGHDLDRTLFARGLLARLDGVVARAGSQEGAADLRRQAARRCRTLGRRITLREGATVADGEVVDLDPDYGLVLRLTDGSLRRFDPVRTRVVGQKGRE